MLSKTPKDSQEKIVSARRLLLFTVVIGLFALSLLARPASELVKCEIYQHNKPYRNDLEIKYNGGVLNAEKVDTESKMELGLSGRDCIKSNQAMLFDFGASNTSDHCFWMKDMKFAIDILWLDLSKQIVHMVHSAEPRSYPQTYCPNTSSRYVLEVKDGYANKNKIQVGDRLNF